MGVGGGVVFRVPLGVLWGVKLRAGPPAPPGFGHRRRRVHFWTRFFHHSWWSMKNQKGRAALSFRSKGECSATSAPAGLGVCDRPFSLPHAPKSLFLPRKRLFRDGAVGHGRGGG